MTIQAEIREPQAKAKALRRQGIVPGSIYGEQGAPSRLISIAAGEAERMLRAVNVGARLEIMLGGQPRAVLLRDAMRDPVSGALQNLGFQAVTDDTRISSTARIVLVDQGKQTASVTQTLFEVPYTALAKDVVDTVYVNVASLPAGTRLTVADLEPLADEKLELGIAPDSLVLKILDNRRQAQQREA